MQGLERVDVVMENQNKVNSFQALVIGFDESV